MVIYIIYKFCLDITWHGCLANMAFALDPNKSVIKRLWCKSIWHLSLLYQNDPSTKFNCTLMIKSLQVPFILSWVSINHNTIIKSCVRVMLTYDNNSSRFSMLGKTFCRQHFEIFFYIFPENNVWHFLQIVSLGCQTLFSGFM